MFSENNGQNGPRRIYGVQIGAEPPLSGTPGREGPNSPVKILEVPDSSVPSERSVGVTAHVHHMTTTQLDPILTPDELADYLHVSSKTLNEWRAAGKGPRCIRLGTSVQAHVRYRVADVAEWLTATNSESAA